MFSPAIQNVLALFLVACAALYLAWQVLRWKKTSGCASGCGRCDMARSEETQRLIRVDELLSKDKS
jgi:hypothetical protein